MAAAACASHRWYAPAAIREGKPEVVIVPQRDVVAVVHRLCDRVLVHAPNLVIAAREGPGGQVGGGRQV